MPEPTPVIGRLAARAFRIPTDAPETDGTLAWDCTTLVVVEISAGGEQGEQVEQCTGRETVHIAEAVAGFV